MCHITYVCIAGSQPWQLRLLANVELNFHCEAVQPRQLFLERWLSTEHYLYRHFALKSSSRPKFDAFRFPNIPYIPYISQHVLHFPYISITYRWDSHRFSHRTKTLIHPGAHGTSDQAHGITWSSRGGRAECG